MKQYLFLAALATVFVSSILIIFLFNSPKPNSQKLVPPTTPTSVPTPIELKTYRNDKFNFTFIYSPEYVYEENTDSILFYVPETSSSFNIKFTKNSNIQSDYQHLKKNFPDASPLTPTSFAGHSAFETKYFATTFYIHDIYLIKNKTLFHFSNVPNSILSTFKFTETGFKNFKNNNFSLIYPDIFTPYSANTTEISFTTDKNDQMISFNEDKYSPERFLTNLKVTRSLKTILKTSFCNFDKYTWNLSANSLNADFGCGVNYFCSKNNLNYNFSFQTNNRNILNQNITKYEEMVKSFTSF